MAKKSSGGFDAQGQRVQNVGTPTDPSDASSKAYVDGLAPKSNFAATSAPTAANDSTQGYAVGSTWMMPGTGDMWRARSVAVGAARWVRMDLADHPGYVAGRYYLPFGQGTTTTGNALVVSTMYLTIGVIKERITVSQLGARVLTASAGGNFQLAIYAHNPATGMPSTLVASTGSGSTATAALVNVALASNLTLEPGHYWFAIQSDNGTAAFTAMAGAGTTYASTSGSPTGAISGSGTSQYGGVSMPATFGTWPSDISSGTFTDAVSRPPAVQFLVASVP